MVGVSFLQNGSLELLQGDIFDKTISRLGSALIWIMVKMRCGGHKTIRTRVQWEVVNLKTPSISQGSLREYLLEES